MLSMAINIYILAILLTELKYVALHLTKIIVTWRD